MDEFCKGVRMIEKLKGVCDSLRNAQGLGDLIAVGTHATKLDKAAEWFATKVLKREGCGCPARQNRMNSLFPFKAPRLCVAIPTCDDLEGLWATLQSICDQALGDKLVRLQRNRSGDQVPSLFVIVVDQSHKEDVRNKAAGYCASISSRGVPVTHIPFPELRGTSPAKSRCHAEAQRMGAEWALICDSHIHFEKGVLKRLTKWLRRHKHRNTKHIYHPVLMNDDGTVHGTHLQLWTDDGLPLIGKDNLWGQWRNDPSLHDPDAHPKEIPAHGGWMLLTRTDVPVYHPLMRGFGDPEGVIHELARARDRKVICLPWLRAYHRFMRTRGVNYDSPVFANLRNHALGFLMLEKELLPHARQFADADSPLDLLEAAWLKNHPNSQAEISQTIAAAVAEYNEVRRRNTKLRRLHPDELQVVSDAPDGVADLQTRYDELCREVSDINEHLPVLARYSQQCDHITEFGTRGGVSTTALLMSSAQVVSYDIQKSCACNGLQKMAGDRLRLEAADTTTMPFIEPTDLLFVDSKHTEEQVFTELSRHGHQVAKWIILHDTSAPFGDMDEAGGSGKGVNAGIRRWLATEHGQRWHEALRLTNNHGLVVLEKNPS